jgi:hypothetical protein
MRLASVVLLLLAAPLVAADPSAKPARWCREACDPSPAQSSTEEPSVYAWCSCVDASKPAVSETGWCSSYCKNRGAAFRSVTPGRTPNGEPSGAVCECQKK